jgi:hypothetical protein
VISGVTEYLLVLAAAYPLKISDSLNSGYYGKAVRTVDIVIRREAKNTHADGLIRKIAGIAK